jgi:hypothetical protein
LEVSEGGETPDVVFEKSLFVKIEHEELLADSLTEDTQARIPAWVKYRFVELLLFMAQLYLV